MVPELQRRRLRKRRQPTQALQPQRYLMLVTNPLALKTPQPQRKRKQPRLKKAVTPDECRAEMFLSVWGAESGVDCRERVAD
jgi:hypothetical protein